MNWSKTYNVILYIYIYRWNVFAYKNIIYLKVSENDSSRSIFYLYCQHFWTMILKLYVLQELFPFKEGKMVPFHATFNENNIYLPYNLFKILML